MSVIDDLKEKYWQKFLESHGITNGRELSNFLESLMKYPHIDIRTLEIVEDQERPNDLTLRVKYIGPDVIESTVAGKDVIEYDQKRRNALARHILNQIAHPTGTIVENAYADRNAPHVFGYFICFSKDPNSKRRGNGLELTLYK